MAETIFCIVNEQRQRIYSDLRSIDEIRIMPAADVARMFFDVYRLTRRTVVEEIVLRPQKGDV